MNIRRYIPPFVIECDECGEAIDPAGREEATEIEADGKALCECCAERFLERFRI